MIGETIEVGGDKMERKEFLDSFFGNEFYEEIEQNLLEVGGVVERKWFINKARRE